MSAARVHDQPESAAPSAGARTPGADGSWVAAALRDTGAGVWEWDLRPDRVRVDDAWRGALGYGGPEAPATAAAAAALVHPDDRVRLLAGFRRLLEGTDRDGEYVGRVRQADGAYQWRHERCTVAERGPDGAPTRIVGVGTTLAEPARPASPRLSWERLFAETRFGMAVVSVADDTFLAVNDAFASMHGYTPDELVGRHVTTTCAASLDPPLDAVTSTIEREGFVVGEFPHRRKDGSTFPALQEITLVRSPGGQPVSRISLVIDLTERERALAALARSEARFRAVYSNAAVGMILTDVSGRPVEVNPGACAMLGYSEAELRGLRFSEITHPDDVQDSVTRRSLLLTGGAESQVFEKRYIRKDGATLWAQVSLSIVEDGEGAPPHVLALIEDISSRRQTLEVLREREQQLRMALDAANAGTFGFDAVRGQSGFSPRALDLYGFNPGETPTFDESLARVHPDDRDRVAQTFAVAMQAQTEFDTEYRVVVPGRPDRWLHTRGRGVYDDAGRLRQAVGVILDITDRKATFEELRSSEERFRLVAEATRDVLWDWNVVTGEHWWSPNAVRLFGHDPVHEPSIAAWTSRLHEEDRQRVVDAVEGALWRGAPSWEGEYRMRLADGSVGEFLDRGHVVHDATGRPVRMIGAMTDVTELKRAHRSLLETHARLRAVGREVHLAESRERAALARELHDEFGQLLTAAKLNASWLKAHAPAAPPPAGDALREKAANLCDVIDMALHGVRHVASQLRPPALDQLGLPRALQGLAAQIERHAGFECVVTIDEATRAAVFGPAEGAALYRMTQELLTNAARHAGAAHVLVSLATTGDAVTLTVQDDGRGLDPGAETRGGTWGLKGIRERAELLGGTMTIAGTKGAGTTVRVTLPRGGGA